MSASLYPPGNRKGQLAHFWGPVDSLLWTVFGREDVSLYLVFAAWVNRLACVPACGVVMGRLKVLVR